jgi:hypothetical protein
MDTKPRSALAWISIAGMALVGLFWEYLFGFACFFSPGWANDPLFGPNFQAVLAAAITGWISLLLLTAAAGVGAVIGLLFALLRVGERHAGRVYRDWLWFAAAVVLFLSIWIFRSVHDWVWKTFPNGHHVASRAGMRRPGDLSRVR